MAIVIVGCAELGNHVILLKDYIKTSNIAFNLLPPTEWLDKTVGRALQPVWNI